MPSMVMLFCLALFDGWHLCNFDSKTSYSLASYMICTYSYSLTWPDRFFPFFFVQRKMEKSGLAMRD